MSAHQGSTRAEAGQAPPRMATEGAKGTQADTWAGVPEQVRHLGQLFLEIHQVCGELAEVLETELAGGAVQSVMASMPSAMSTELPKLLSTADLARVLGVDDRTVRRMRDRGDLPPAIDLGSVLRWRPEDVERWLAERTEGTP